MPAWAAVICMICGPLRKKSAARLQTISSLCRFATGRIRATVPQANPTVSRHDVLTCAQKLLDRVLFIAFCESRGLLPEDSIKKAYEHRDPYHPRSIWENFRGLFRAINLGNAALDIPAYNGGLFADDPVLNALTVNDNVCAHFRDLANYDYRKASEVATDGEPPRNSSRLNSTPVAFSLRIGSRAFQSLSCW